MRRLMIIVTTLLLLVSSVSAAVAERPLFRDHVKFTDEVHLLEELSAACGFDVFHVERVNAVIRGFEDRLEINVSGQEVFTTAAGDPGVTARFSHHGTVVEEVSSDGDTQTIVSERTFRGLPSMWRQKGEGVFLRDAGFAHFTVTVTLDTSGETPVLLDTSMDIHEVHGPHPELEMSDEEFLATICGAFAAGTAG